MMQPKLLAVATCKEGINESARPSPTLPLFGLLLNKSPPSTRRPCVRDLAFVGREDELAQMTSQMSSAA